MDCRFSSTGNCSATSFGNSRVDLYDGEIRFTDLHVGRVLARLKEAGLWGRTAVVLTGDHGEGFGEHGVELHGYHLYAPQTKVPLIIRVPGLAGRRATTPARYGRDPIPPVPTPREAPCVWPSPATSGSAPSATGPGPPPATGTGRSCLRRGRPASPRTRPEFDKHPTHGLPQCRERGHRLSDPNRR